MGFLELIGMLTFGIVAASILGSLTTVPGRCLRSSFRRAGILAGKTKEEITSLVGSPTSVSCVAGGELLQWQATGYHVALMFSNGICKGVVHETDIAGRAILFD